MSTFIGDEYLKKIRGWNIYDNKALIPVICLKKGESAR